MWQKRYCGRREKTWPAGFVHSRLPRLPRLGLFGSDNSPIYAWWIPLPFELPEESFVRIHHRYF